MITNFEDVTKELTEEEMALIPYLIQGLKTHGKTNPITSNEIVKKMNVFSLKMGLIKLDGARLRKCINFIRSTGLHPVMANSKGYFTSYDQKVIVDQIKSLMERSRSIKSCADGMMKFILKN